MTNTSSLKDLRKSKRLRQKDIGAAVGLSASAISRLEAGITRKLDSTKVLEYAKVLGVEIEELLATLRG